jgi:flavodoxin
MWNAKAISELKEEITMDALLVVYSYHHNNTLKIAEVFAKVLDAKIVTPQQANPQELQKYTLIGFGAGIDSGKHYKPLLDFADQLPDVPSKKAFIFSTSGVSNPKYKTKIHTSLKEKLQTKGYSIVDEFNCHGFNTNSFLKVFGGMNKGRPNTEDLKIAETFAKNLLKI